MAKTFVQQAMEFKRNRAKQITQDHIDLALAWANGEVSITQVERVLYKKTGGMNAYVDLARSLKQAIITGQLKVVKK